jgi:hypothetical protein
MCPCEQPDEPAPDSPKPDSPKPAPPSSCCCYDLDWLKPSPPQKVKADMSVVAFLPLTSGLPPGAVLPDQLGLSIPGPSPPLHLLKCVWLC